ncbi:MAG: type II toxin-antitoxin system ParD family antitoxin [Candidatus Sumerlaeota bacterium]|nr:type II toxin-antitoxin system ParD family antitoxin [Candidatus Sumerlaeota bacterium]
MNISLTPQLEKMVRKKVSAGLYTSSSEVVREALRLLDAQDQICQAKLKALKTEIAIGLHQADKGELLDGREFFARMRRRHSGS